MNIKITSVTILKGNGADIMLLHTELPNPIWPFTGNMVLKVEAAAGRGEVYLQQHLPDVEVEVVDLNKETRHEDGK